MITVTRPDGRRFALNADLIERIERTTPTVVVLVDGARHAVLEPLDEVVALVCDFRAAVVARVNTVAPPSPPELRLVNGD